MSQQALLTRIVEALDGAGIPYMLTGSLASSLQGEPRASHDIDLVIDIAPDDAARVTQALSAPAVYLDEHAVSDAARRRTMFNLIDSVSGDKADFWLLTDDPFDLERFARRLRTTALGLELSVSTPEDTILMKLRWSAKAGGSEKQVNDALGVYGFQSDVLDEAYLGKWAEILGVSAALAEIRSRRSAETGHPSQGRAGPISAADACVAIVQRHGEAGPIIAALAQGGIGAEVVANQRPGLLGRAAQVALFPQRLVSDGPWEVRVAADDAERARRIVDEVGPRD